MTWLWTVNIINNTQHGKIPPPDPWWPGNSYVTWVGIDGYYLKSSWQFAPLFGPTIAAVRALTSNPDTHRRDRRHACSGPARRKSPTCSPAFTRTGYSDSSGSTPLTPSGSVFGISSPDAFDAFRKGASTYTRPGS